MFMKRTDRICINGLRINCHVGVPDEERAQPQELLVSVVMFPQQSEESLNDEIERTIDYYAVSLRLEEVACGKPRKLIETLAEDLAACVLDEFEVSAVSVEVEKFILPNTRSVAVSVHRERE